MPYTTRSKKTQPKKNTKAPNKKKGPTRRTKTSTNPAQTSPREDQSPPPTDTQGQPPHTDPSINPSGSNNNNPKVKGPFRSRFPQLELDMFEDELPKWTLVGLREAIVHQDSRRSKAPKEIKDLVKIMRFEFEKRILMIALMAGVPEVVIWNLVIWVKESQGQSLDSIPFLLYQVPW
ncbi:uncharacterized protein MELLADRAFT_70891 [Melampsora larici-populina 98AG31]|uniref:Uncharacterized protein n=1 Tax=Melampsora larici-populina (strain 98AG31 / pathotype 3-4-7) TaxID=747676 RepID=F4R974_MELLP|nr:uncharacterized protein MELLADRAFT_70891 [Melampsora larici-populina 98AG31]EGG11201.1 hypothetical protein MELLADRAFT_70891 [Melampsora larici-populina 98AG31]